MCCVLVGIFFKLPLPQSQMAVPCNQAQLAWQLDMIELVLRIQKLWWLDITEKKVLLDLT